MKLMKILILLVAIGIATSLSAQDIQYEKAAETGNGMALYLLSEMYAYGDRGVPKDETKAFEYAKRAADTNEPKGFYMLGYCYEKGCGTPINLPLAVSNYQKAADLGEIWALPKLSEMYAHGLGVPKNGTKAFEYAKRAADANDYDGFNMLGVCYENGYGTPINLPLAVSNYQKTAGLSSHANWRLYRLYGEGRGVAKNTQLAFQYLWKAVNQNRIEAMWCLGLEYYTGENLNRDNGAAIEWMTKAATGGHSYAAGVLGTFYYKGDPAPKDYDKAFNYLLQAAQNAPRIDDNKLLAEVYRDLGACYRFGRGTTVNEALASYYTEKAAELGDTDSFDAVKALRDI